MRLDITFPGKILISDSLTHFTDFLATIASESNRCLIVAGGPRTQESRAFSTVSTFLSTHGVKVSVLPRVGTNPEASVVVTGSKQARESQADTIVTIGGGSSHDTGKLIAVLARQQADLGDLVIEARGYEKISKDVLPVFCIPTLAGTGAEISPASLVKIGNQKKIVFSQHMRPRKTYYSLPLMFSADYETNILTAFDAYVQSLEAYLSTEANPWSDMLALSGMTDAATGLLSFARDQSNMAAREKLVYAAIKGIMAVSSASVGGIHALSDPLSGQCSVHHGTALSMVASAVLNLNAPACPARYRDAAAVLSEISVEPDGTRDLPRLVEGLLDQVSESWRTKRSALAKSLPDLQQLVMESRNADMLGNPRKLSDTEIGAAFVAAFGH